MKYVLLIYAGLMTTYSFADSFNLIIDSPSQMVCKVLQDPKTKVIFYLESDRHHLSAINPQGKLLWQLDTWKHLSTQKTKTDNLINFIDLYQPSTPLAGLPLENLGVKNRDDYLTVSYNDGVEGLIKRSTGEFVFWIRN